MNLSDIITKCYILALIIRDDGERLLLGDGIYEFKSSLQHFAPNIYQNDIVELQGTDGQLLAGQVRRSATQAFDGYIADGTIGKTDTEQSRRRFLGFFRKKHHYKVVYIMPDGTAVQRDRGYIVDAPAVQELYQRFPEYHIGLNFEDPNYYEYSENDEGEEIYTHIQAIALFRELEAGLVWDAFGAVSDDIAWTEYMTKNSTDGYILIGNGLPVEAPLSLTHLYGNATQTTLSGKNLLKIKMESATSGGLTWTLTDETISLSGTASSTSSNSTYWTLPTPLPAGTYTFSIPQAISYKARLQIIDENGTAHAFGEISAGSVSRTQDSSWQIHQVRLVFIGWTSGDSVDISLPNKLQLEAGSTATDYEPYCGGIPSPNPDYPQDIQVLTGDSTVKITGKNLLDTSDPHNQSAAGMTATWNNGVVEVKGTNTATSFPLSDNIALPTQIKAGTEISVSFVGASVGNTFFRFYNQATSQYESLSVTNPNTSSTYTLTRDADAVQLYKGGVPTNTYKEFSISNWQIELGNQATDYEEFKDQSYVIPFGDTYLAKIGDYADEPVNVGGTWYIRRAIGKKVFSGSSSESWQYTSGDRARFSINISDLKKADNQYDIVPMMSDYFISASVSQIYNRQDNSIGAHYDYNQMWLSCHAITSVNDFKTWLSTHNTTVYYALATPTDTEITDSELIEQLNHIYSLYQGTNNMWLIPSAGAQGEMTVRFGVAYDDDGSGYHWSEELGSPDNIISNDGIDSVRPIWTINGPATNPSLTNITTAQTITWNGTVPADSTLTIDMERQTATLNGANVYAQIEGDWLELAVGPNKLQYTASGGATASSTLEWNGVAG